MTILKIFLVSTIFTLIVIPVRAFDIENCPEECHCQMDGLLMFVDCSGAGLKELPEFPDNQVQYQYILNYDLYQH